MTDYVPDDDDWRPPHQVLLEREWKKHPQHARLAELSTERNESGELTWHTRVVPDHDDPSWTAMWLTPTDPLDERPPIRVVRFPNSWLERQAAIAQAIAEEHFPDPPEGAET
jgi:hypothetical protein